MISQTITKLEKIVKTLFSFPYFHPFLFTIYPILFFYSHNISELIPNVVVSPLMYAVLVTIILLGVLYLIFRDYRKSSILASLVIFLFFSYHSISEFATQNFGVQDSDRFVFIFYLTVLVISVVLVNKSKAKLKEVTILFNVISLTLVAVVVGNILSYELQIRNQLDLETETVSEDIQMISESDKRDIYYIILDAYGRKDILEEYYDFDNSAFINFLEGRGFFVAKESTNNFAFTRLSLPSTFNFEYLNYLTDEYGTTRETMDPVLVSKLHYNEVGRFLKSQGYTYINFDSGWSSTQEIADADINIREGKFFSLFGKSLDINEFHYVLLNTTALSPFLQETLAEEARQRVRYNFDKLAEVPYMREKTFVLAHFILPHPPYLFDEYGEPVSQERIEAAGEFGIDKELDIKQLQYTNQLAQAAIEKILQRSDREPIIIVASDHGPLIPRLDSWPEEPTDDILRIRMSNLNAFYFPDGGREQLYDSITPVNTFRILFNYYFGTDYDLLEDRNYFSWANEYYQFYDVTDQLKNNSQ